VAISSRAPDVKVVVDTISRLQFYQTVVKLVGA
jgi:hypothetical protein